MEMRTNDAYEAQTARAAVYKLLAECYYPPTGTLREPVEQLRRSLKTLGSPAAASAERMDAALQAHETLAELAIDHARLFVGPFALLSPPYGSIYLDGERRLMGDSTLSVDECYHEVGLEVAAGFNGTPDHIAVELEFMHFLIVKEIAAAADGELERAQNFRQKQRAFLERHLAAWVPDFSDSVEKQAQTGFYQSLAAATRLYIESDFSRCHGEAPVLLSGSPAAGHIFQDQRGTRP
jgi:TorA maturation chaperone TorD